MKGSHPLISAGTVRARSLLSRADKGEALLGILHVLNASAQIQRSWLAAGEPLVRYEDLLAHPLEELHRALVALGGQNVSEADLQAAIEANRFEKLSGGRPNGVEDPASHYRKGVAGDWKNHFTPRVTARFKERFGDLLIATGYERDLNW
jgi:lipopolysaccharide transport system ATP-binding protein